MKKRLVIGIVLLVISYLLSFLLTQSTRMFVPEFIYFLFVAGFVLIFDSIILHFYKKSLLNSLIKSKRNILMFVIVSFVGAIGIELILNWSGKFWIYPTFNWTIYLLSFIPGFAIY